MTQIRILPAHTPFFKRDKPRKRWTQPKMCRFLRERTPWGRWIKKYVRKIRPRLIDYDVADIQPMTGPVGLIYSIRPRYTDVHS